MADQEKQITDTKAYVQGYNRGHELCIHQKKLTSMTAAMIRSLISRSFHDSYHQGLQDGYQEGFKSVKKELQKQRSEDFERLKEEKAREQELER